MEYRSQKAFTANKTESILVVQQEKPAGTETLQGSTFDECDMWCDYWRLRNQPWRTEQEIGNQRQVELTNWRSTLPSVGQSRYPLGGVTLNRADVEWLLASHESGQGPIEWAPDVRYKAHLGLDVRGADLRKARLAGLPLASMRGGLSPEVWSLATDVQREEAAVRLEGADLRGAHLEGADLCGARLEGADLLRRAPGGRRSTRRAPGGRRSTRRAPGGRRSTRGAPGGEWACACQPETGFFRCHDQPGGDTSGR